MGGRRPPNTHTRVLPLVCPDSKSQHCAATEVRACKGGGGGGSLAPPGLKILDKNANPEGKERTKKESVHHARLRLRTHHPSCTDCIPAEAERRGEESWGVGGAGRGEDRIAAKNGSDTSAGERGPRGREALAGEGLRPAEPNKASTSTPQLPGGGGGGQSQQHPLPVPPTLSGRWKTKVRSGSEECRVEALRSQQRFCLGVLLRTSTSFPFPGVLAIPTRDPRVANPAWVATAAPWEPGPGAPPWTPTWGW